MIRFLFLFLVSFSVYADLPISPNPNLTPGSFDSSVTIKQICTPGRAKKARKVSLSKKKKVFVAYHIDPNSSKFEIDHLIPLSLGGSNNVDNLWPQSYLTSPYNAYDKDKLETKFHAMVCSGKLELKTAREKIAKDWIKADKEYIE